MNENDGYKAMESLPWNILEWWKGQWVFAACHESESEARRFFGVLNTPQILRYKTQIIERRGPQTGERYGKTEIYSK